MKKTEKKYVVQRNFTSEIKSFDMENAIIESIISTDTIDRYNEVIVPEGINTKGYTGTVLWAHDVSIPAPAKNVGLRIEGNKVIARTQFAVKESAFAKELFALYAGEYIKAFSVGFLPVKWEDGDGKAGSPERTYHEIDLLEYSLVNIPANPDAQTLAIQKGIITKDCSSIKGFEDWTKKVEKVHKPEPDITENYIRLRQEDPDLFIDDSFRTIDISEEKGIKAVIGKYKDDPDGPTHIQSYLFDKEKWSVDEAEAWVAEHKDYTLTLNEYGFTFLKNIIVEETKEFLEITPPAEVIEITPKVSAEVTFDFTVDKIKSIKKEEIDISAEEVKSIIDTQIKSVINEVTKAIAKEIKYNLGVVD